MWILSRYVCRNCLTRALSESTLEIETFNALNAVNGILTKISDISNDRNLNLVSLIMHNLASKQKSLLDNEIREELQFPKTLNQIKNESDELCFLTNPRRNLVLLRTLLGFANLSANTPLEMIGDKKLYSMCTAYEGVLSMTHSKVTTVPAVLRNLRLYKTTHSQKLLEVIGAPSGGQRTLLRSLINEELPPLMPPSNDFVSCDDNLQVKRVTSSSKLKEQFKHTVKVVNSHVYFQNTSDKLNHVLKNAQNQPKFWLTSPSRSVIEKFENKILDYEKQGRKVRNNLAKEWFNEELAAKESNLDLVAKLDWLRRSRDGEYNIYPCPNCGGEGKLKRNIWLF